MTCIGEVSLIIFIIQLKNVTLGKYSNGLHMLARTLLQSTSEFDNFVSLRAPAVHFR